MFGEGRWRRDGHAFLYAAGVEAAFDGKLHFDFEAGRMERVHQGDADGSGGEGLFHAIDCCQVRGDLQEGNPAGEEEAGVV